MFYNCQRKQARLGYLSPVVYDMPRSPTITTCSIPKCWVSARCLFHRHLALDQPIQRSVQILLARVRVLTWTPAVTVAFAQQKRGA